MKGQEKTVEKHLHVYLDNSQLNKFRLIAFFIIVPDVLLGVRLASRQTPLWPLASSRTGLAPP